MKLLIVDDDDIIREVIKNIAIEENLGFEIIEEAENGKEAIEKSVQLKPDIIITDIRMPGMDGFGFMEKTRGILQDSKFIILSGFDDFKYAQQAIKFGVCEYLLKPYSRSDMVNLLKNYINIINSERVIKERNKNLSKFFNENYDTIKEREVLKVFEKAYSLSNEELSSLLNSIIGSDFSGDYYAVLNIDIDSREHICSEVYNNNSELMSFAVKNIVSELAEESFKGITFKNNEDEIQCALSFKGNKQDFESKLYFLVEKIRYMVKKFLKHTVTITVGRTFNNLRKVNESWKEINNFKHFKLFSGYDSILKCVKLGKKTKQYNIQNKIFEEILGFILDGDEIKLNFQIEELFKEIYAFNNLSALSVKKAFSRLIIYIYNELSLRNAQIEEILGDDISCWNKILKIERLQDLKHWLKDILIKILKHVESSREEKKSKSIESALKFINENYHLEFTLEEIADKVNLNPNYFSELFKKEVGVNFIDYVTEVRIKAAKRLLSKKEKKISEIAKEVGYKDASYFCKVFKRVTGESPKNFR